MSVPTGVSQQTEEPPPTFGAAKATAAFGLLILAQVLTGVAVIIGTMLFLIASGADPNRSNFTGQFLAAMNVPLLITSGLISALVAYAVARLWAWHLVIDKTENGLGVRAASSRNVLVSLFVGVLIAASFVAVARWVVPYDPATPLGPLAAAAAAGGASRFAWALLAVGLAPAIEEFFFRGLMLKGFSASWGKVAGPAFVTMLFVALHLFETLRYWPATLAVLALGLATLAARLLSGSLLTAVAVHFAYNAVVVVSTCTAG